MSPYPSSAGQYSTQPSLPPHPKYFGQIHLLNASLVQPYFNLCNMAFDRLSRKEMSRYGADIMTSILKARSKAKRNAQSWSPPRPAIGGQNGIPDRPAIVCPTPPGFDQTRVWLFLMGTFDGRDASAIPSVLKEFAVRVHTKDLRTTETGDSVHTTPEWDAHGTSAWVVLIPVTTIDGFLPVQRWERNGKQYYVEPKEVERLRHKSIDLINIFRAKAKDPVWLAQFVNALCKRYREDPSYIPMLTQVSHPKAENADPESTQRHSQPINVSYTFPLHSPNNTTTYSKDVEPTTMQALVSGTAGCLNVRERQARASS